MGQYERRNNPIIFYVFNKPSNKKKEPMVTLKNNCFVLRQENVSILMLPIFLLPLVNDPGQASTLENQGFPRNKCALHAL